MPVIPSIPSKILKNSSLSVKGSITISLCVLSTGCHPRMSYSLFPMCNTSLTNLHGAVLQKALPNLYRSEAETRTGKGIRPFPAIFVLRVYQPPSAPFKNSLPSQYAGCVHRNIPHRVQNIPSFRKIPALAAAPKV